MLLCAKRSILCKARLWATCRAFCNSSFLVHPIRPKLHNRPTVSLQDIVAQKSFTFALPHAFNSRYCLPTVYQLLVEICKSKSASQPNAPHTRSHIPLLSLFLHQSQQKKHNTRIQFLALEQKTSKMSRKLLRNRLALIGPLESIGGERINTRKNRYLEYGRSRRRFKLLCGR
jgi:hypothetical protein